MPSPQGLIQRKTYAKTATYDYNHNHEWPSHYTFVSKTASSMTRFLTILFLIIYTTAIIRPVIPVVRYHIQMQEYIRHCENAAKPELKCNGQCQLRKELVATTAYPPDAQPAPLLITSDEFLASFLSEIQDVLILNSLTPVAHTTVPVVILNSPAYFEVFHPPLTV